MRAKLIPLFLIAAALLTPALLMTGCAASVGYNRRYYRQDYGDGFRHGRNEDRNHRRDYHRDGYRRY